MSWFANRAIDVYLAYIGITKRAPLLRAAQNPKVSQDKLLRRIMRDNAQTSIGQRYGFADITSLEAYRQRVPIHGFDDLADCVAAQQNGERALTMQKPVYYTRTSGTTGRTKDIPLTRHGLAQIGDVQKHLAYSLWRDTGFLRGALLAFASPAREGRLPNGVSYGATSGSAYRSLSPILESKFAVPRAAFAIGDAEEKYRIYALGVLARGDITGAVAANPSSILKVARIIQDDGPALLHALSCRQFDGFSSAAQPVAQRIAARMDGERVEVLCETLARDGALGPAQVWPSLSAIACWTGGSCGAALTPLMALLPPGVRVVEYGYSASEFMGTVNVDARANIGLPQLTHNVYEFVPRAAWDAGDRTCLGLHELEVGEEYHIVVTTRSGLYRYHINDVVRAVSGKGGCPGLVFLQKGRGVTNITGEKLCEHQVITAMQEVLKARGIPAHGFVVLADEHAARYTVCLETDAVFDEDAFASAVDDAFKGANSEYADKRASSRLAGPQVVRWRMGAGEMVKGWALAQNMREAQYKPVLLDYLRNWTEFLPQLVAKPECVVP